MCKQCGNADDVTCEECTTRERERIAREGLRFVPQSMIGTWHWFVSKYEIKHYNTDARDVVECFLASME